DQSLTRPLAVSRHRAVLPEKPHGELPAIARVDQHGRDGGWNIAALFAQHRGVQLVEAAAEIAIDTSRGAGGLTRGARAPRPELLDGAIHRHAVHRARAKLPAHHAIDRGDGEGGGGDEREGYHLEGRNG